MAKRAGRPSFGIEANLDFVRYTFAAIGVTPYVIVPLGVGEIRLALDIQGQKAAIWSGLADANVPLGDNLRLGAAIRYAVFNQSKIAEIEGLETLIDRSAMLAGGPWIQAVFLEVLRVRAEARFYSLGNTAIASKEFAMVIAEQTLFRLGLEVGLTIGKMELSARFFKVTGVRDDVELPYQAPILHRDYLLSRLVADLGVSWKF